MRANNQTSNILSDVDFNRVHEIKFELGNLLRVGRDLLETKSREEWLKCRDNNIKWFHKKKT